MSTPDLAAIRQALLGGSVVPYLGPGVLALDADNAALPSMPEMLVKKLVEKTSVPHKIRNNLTGAAQFIENFKHRKTVVASMTDAFSVPAHPTLLHRFLAELPALPLVVDVWYDNAMATALAGRGNWGQIQGLSQSEHFGQWTQAYGPDGAAVDDADVERWDTLLYKPRGGVTPAKNYLVSDSDYVEVLTEIDIQTPIPLAVQHRRIGRSFLFLGCRFADQLERTFARQIMKRSCDTHFAVLPGEPTRNEARFLEEQNIQRIDMPLVAAVAELVGMPSQAAQVRAAVG